MGLGWKSSQVVSEPAGPFECNCMADAVYPNTMDYLNLILHLLRKKEYEDIWRGAFSPSSHSQHPRSPKKKRLRLKLNIGKTLRKR